MRSTDALNRVRRGARGVAYGLLFALVVVYPVCVLVEVAPASPATNRVRPITNKVIDPLFVQRWTLFAPDPPDTNVTSYYEVRYGEGGITTSAVVPLSDAAIDAARRHRWAPTRVERAITNADRTLARLAVIARAFDRNSAKLDELAHPIPEDPFAEAIDTSESVAKTRAELLAARADLDRQIATERDRLVRMVSAIALARFGPSVVSLRITVVTTPVRRFSTRNKHVPEPEATLSYDTGWTDVVRGVGS